METKNKETMVEKVCKKLLFQKIFLVNPSGTAGGLALMWQEEVLLKVKTSSKYYIDVDCMDPDSRQHMQITFIHASTNFGERLTLWQTLGHIKPNSSWPWICMGDFNEILYVWEKVGKKEADNSRIAAFRNMINDLSLMDMDSHGCAYTWANNRDGKDLVKKRLDRALCTLEWRITFSEAEVQALPAIGSDHSPLILRLYPGKTKTKRSFKMEVFWTEHEEYYELMQQTWKSNSTSPCTFSEKLKETSKVLAQ